MNYRRNLICDSLFFTASLAERWRGHNTARFSPKDRLNEVKPIALRGGISER
jgi:hypothetical protein